MRNIINPLAFLLLTLLTIEAKGQNIKIIANPLQIEGYMPRTIGIQFENKLNLKNSLGLGIEYYCLEPNHSGDGEYNGIKVNITSRRYFNNQELYRGFFVSPSLNFLHTDIPEGDEPIVRLKSGTRTGFGLRLQIGQQFLLGKNLIMGYGFGPAYFNNRIKSELVDGTKGEYRSNDIELNISFQIGWKIK